MQVLNAFNYMIDAVILLINVFMTERIGSVNNVDIHLSDLFVAVIIISIILYVVRRLGNA